jgi:hypothetical protein
MIDLPDVGETVLFVPGNDDRSCGNKTIPGIVHGHSSEPGPARGFLRIFVLRGDGTSCVRHAVPHWSARPARSSACWAWRSEQGLIP